MKKQIIEGLEVPTRLEFGNEAHILLRDRIEKRKLIRQNGIRCPSCGSKMKCVGEVDINFLQWQCACGDSYKLNRDTDDYDFDGGGC